MAGSVKWNLAEWLIVALILFSVLVEKILHRLEHWIQHKHPPLQAVLRNVYRELMILGIVSFGFIMYIFLANPPSDIKMTFEVAHVFIFLFAVFHTVVVSFSVFISLRLSSYWKRLERMDLAEYVQHKTDYEALHAVRSRHRSFWWRRFVWWLPDPRRARRHTKLHEILAFHETRFQFIDWRALPPDFRFAKFLRRIKSSIFLQLVEIHWTHFTIFVITILLDIARSALNLHPSTGPAFLMLGSVFNAIFVTALAIKIRRVYWKMTKNAATYCDPNSTGNTPANPAHPNENDELDGVEECVPKRINFDDTVDTASASGLPGSKKKKSVGFAEEPERAETNGIPEDNVTEDRIESNAQSSLRNNKLRRRVPQATQSSSDLEDDALGKAPSVPVESNGAGGSVESIQTAIAQRSSLQKLSTFRRVLKLDAMQRLQSNDSDKQEEDDEPKKQVTNYPWWVLKVAPRLGRVASPAEKLFWFGSHTFYMWCVAWVLFFSNINTAATIAKIAFLLKERNSKYPGTTKSSAHFIMETVMRAAAASGASKPAKNSSQNESMLLLLIALLVAVLVLLYVLLHIAGIMKKYIFVMNNANLLPESITVDSIETVRLKNILPSDTTRQEDTSAGYRSEEDEQDFSQMRRNMSRFIRSNEIGPIDAGDV